MTQDIAIQATAHSPAITTATPRSPAGKIAAGLHRLRPSWFVFGAGFMLLAACANGVSESNTVTYGQGAFWQGGTCFSRTKGGKMVRVSRSNCPPQPEAEAPADGTTTTTTN